MAADVADIVRAGTMNRKRFRLIIFLDLNLIKGGITVIFYPKSDRVGQFIVIYQLNKTLRVNLLSPANYFVSTGIVYVFNKKG
jgi:hypothetical protein